MTNFEYVMTKMTERNFADIFCNDLDMVFEHKTFGHRIKNAFSKWRGRLDSYAIEVGNDIYGKHRYSVFNRCYFDGVYSLFSHQLNGKFRKENLSFQVWLSKQYNPEEWD